MTFSVRAYFFSCLSLSAWLLGLVGTPGNIAYLNRIEGLEAKTYDILQGHPRDGLQNIPGSYSRIFFSWWLIMYNGSARE